MAIAFFTTRRIDLLDKKEFIMATLDKKAQTFVIYMPALIVKSIYLSKQAQIRALITKVAFTKIQGEYLNFTDVS